MTGKLVYRVDAHQLALYSTPARDGSGPPASRTGMKTADLEITIDLDQLRELVATGAMHTKRGTSSRLGGAIRVKPIGQVKTTGEGKPLW